MSNIEIVRTFISHWEAQDLDSICAAVTPDIFYHNIPMPVINSREDLREFAAPLLDIAERVQWETHFIAETELGTVLTERTDNFHMSAGKTISIRVMGTFEVNADGLIYKWRDYFDLGQFQSQMTS